MNAACEGAETELFYQHDRWGEAAMYCHRCPVQLKCRMDFATDPYPYAGGMTPDQRSAWLTRSRITPPAPKPTGPQSRIARVSEEQRAECIRIFDTEMIGTKAIAERVGIAKSTCQRVLRRAGRHRTPDEQQYLARLGALSGGQRGVGERNDEMVRKLLAENYTTKEIAEMVGITRSHVYVVKRRIGA